MIKARMDMVSPHGNYYSTDREFNDEKHMNNWIAMMTKKGHKTIGIHDDQDKNQEKPSADGFS